MTSKEAFEAWVTETWQPSGERGNRLIETPYGYKEHLVDVAWRAWQAATEAAAQEVKALREALEKIAAAESKALDEALDEIVCVSMDEEEMRSIATEALAKVSA